MDESDAYDDEFEAASASSPSPRRDRTPPSPVPPQPSPPAFVPAPALESRAASPPPTPSSAYASPIVRPPTRARPPAPVPQATRTAARTALDQAQWTFTVRAARVRALRVPVAARPDENVAVASGSIPAIRDLRVFAVIDKQPVQSRGSRWKQESRVAEAARPLVIARRASSPSSAGPRSGVLEEASWRNDDGELAWVFSMDRFRRLKAYSPRIKLFVFGIGANARAESVRALSEDSPRHHRESIVSLGWFFLDLRTPDLPERWLKLQNARFGGEILVSTTFAPTTARRERSSGDWQALGPARIQEPLNIATRHRQHSTSSDSGYLRLGDGRGSEVYLFTVFIRGATDIRSVLKSSVVNAEEERRAIESGVWLSYSLFDVVVQTDLFYNLQRAEFAPIRDTFRVMASRRDVLDIVKKQKLLSIYLCTHDRVLANADLPFTEFIERDMFSSSATDAEDGATISGTFPFGSTPNGGVSVSFSIERGDDVVNKGELVESTAVVSVAASEDPKTDHPDTELKAPTFITVRQVHVRLDALRIYAGKEVIELEVSCGDHAVRCPIRFNAFTADYALGDCQELLLEIDRVYSSEGAQPLSVTLYSSTTDHSIASSVIEDQADLKVDGDTALALYQDDRQLGECILTCTHKMEDHRENRSKQDPCTVPGVSHTYRVFIRLKALRDFETSRPIVISYVNPFTNHERVETPLISVMRKAETQIPEAYCLFELHRDEASVKEAMETPVVMDVAIALPDGSRERVGNIIFSLNFLYFSEASLHCAHASCGASLDSEHAASKHWADEHSQSGRDQHNGEQVTRALKRCSIYLPVTSAHETGKPDISARRVGAVQIEAYFEDAGPMSDTEVRFAEEMRVSRTVDADDRELQFLWGSEKTGRGARGLTDGVEPATKASRQDRDSEELRDSVDQPHLNTSRSFDDQKQNMGAVKEQLQLERNLWIQEQKAEQARWKKRIAEMEKARMDELEEEWARREEERSAVLKAAQVEYQNLEQKLRATLAEVETRERKLALAEAALERDQRMLREDTDLLRKRLQSEQSHGLSQAQKQIETLEKKVSDLHGYLQTAEKRALQVEEDFAEYRKQQRKVPESKLREEIASLRGQVVELERAKLVEIRAREHADANVDKMKSQLEKMAKLVQAEKKKNESRVMDDLEKLRLKYIAREERYVLDGDREELRAIKKQLEDLRRVQVSTHSPQVNGTDHLFNSHKQYRGLQVVTEQPPDSPSTRSSALLSSPRRIEGRRHSWSSDGFRSPETTSSARRPRVKDSKPNVAFNDREIGRLVQERDSLLASGVYDQDSYLVRELERRIVLRQDQLTQHRHAT